MRCFVLVLLIAAVVLSASDAKHECLLRAVELSNSLGQTRASLDTRTLLTMYTSLSPAVQDAIKKCDLNMEAAKKRCDTSYPGRCEQISPAAFQVKCDSRFKRVGCCHCGMHCPTNSWREDEYHCYKPATTESTVYVNEVSCGQGCEEIAGKFVKQCAEGTKRVGLRHCVAVCPLGWHDEGARCRKPAVYRLTQPFFWVEGDN